MCVLSRRFNPELFKLVDPLGLKKQDNGAYTATFRAETLRNNPVLAARIAHARITALVDQIYLGSAKPFGKVTDYWYRIEFQARGTPHAHGLYWIDKNGEEHSIDVPEGDPGWENLKRYVERTISCWLPAEVTSKEARDEMSMDDSTTADLKAAREAESIFVPQYGISSCR